jgi:ketosteroid isomerase-like protein
MQLFLLHLFVMRGVSWIGHCRIYTTSSPAATVPGHAMTRVFGRIYISVRWVVEELGLKAGKSGPAGLASGGRFVSSRDHTMKLLHLSTALVVAISFSTFAQSPSPKNDSDQLVETIAQMDAKIFSAFNAHDANGVMSLFTEDVEFYHDKDGVSNYQQTAESLKNLFASVPDIRRDLVTGTLEVYPIKDYGAIEIGVHRFTHKENGKEETGSFKFLHIWRQAGGSWKISRVVSYGH